MSPLRDALRDYLQMRRALGYQFKQQGQLLEDFVGFLERAGAERITTELALCWAKLPKDVKPYRWTVRLGMVRGFARYLATIDPDSEIPPKDVLPARQQRPTPHIYSPAEIQALMDAAGALRPPLHAATHRTLIGLLAATGIRVGEALGLDRQDVDLKDAVLRVRGKNDKLREVPLHESTSRALRDYARVCDRYWPERSAPAFFISINGTRLRVWSVHKTFRKLTRRAGLQSPAQRAPRARGRRRALARPHDFRHTYAVATVLDWHRDGEDVDAKLPLLSTYLGHVKPEHTYWYLQAVPELMQVVAARLDGLLGGIS
jgi:integrase/recombinase XerD